MSKLTFLQFYKANKERRKVLAKKYGYNDPSSLMAFLKKNGTIEDTQVKSYDQFNSFDKATQLKIAKQEGYSTVAAYKSRLRAEFKVKNTNKKVTEIKTPKEPVTILSVLILDESSSMNGPKAKAMLEGVKAYLNNLKNNKEDNVNYLISLVPFANEVSPIVINSDIDSVKVGSTIRGGSTALHDAVGTVLTYLQSHSFKNTKKIVQIFTDGEENNSRKFNAQKVANLIKEAEANNTTVTFMGTERDVKITTTMYSLSKGNTLVHNNTAESIGETFKMSSKATVAYSKAVVQGENVTSNFYSKVLITEKNK